VPPGGPAPSNPAARTIDDLDLKPAYGVPRHAALRFRSSRAATGHKSPILFWLDARQLLVIDHSIWASRHVARIWDVPSGRLTWYQAIEKQGGSQGDHQTWELDRKHKRLSLVWEDMRVVDLRTRKIIWRHAQPDGLVARLPNRVRFSPDGELVIVPRRKDHFGVWSLKTGKRLSSIAPGKAKAGEYNELHFASFSPGGRFVVMDGRIKLVELRTGKVVKLPIQRKDLRDEDPLIFGDTDEQLMITNRRGGVINYNPVRRRRYRHSGAPPRTLGPAAGSHHKLMVQESKTRCIVRTQPSGRILMQYKSDPDKGPFCIDEAAKRSLQTHGKLRIIDRARLRLPLKLTLPAGEKLTTAERVSSVVFIRTNRRVLLVHPDDRAVPVANSLWRVFSDAMARWSSVSYDRSHRVLSAVDVMNWPNLYLWRVPSGKLLNASRSAAGLDNWLKQQRVKWRPDNPANSKRLRRKWVGSNQEGVSAPDGRVGAVLSDEGWLVLRRTMDGAELWRRDYRRKTPCGLEHPRRPRLAWSARGGWLASYVPPGEGMSCYKPELRVLSRKTGRSKIFWKSSIDSGPVFAPRGTDFVVADEGHSEHTTDIRRYDASTGKLRWRTKVAGRCHGLVIDPVDRVLAVMEHPALHFALVQVRPRRTLIKLPAGLELVAKFSPRARYLHTEHLDRTEYLWRIPGWRAK